MDIHLIREYKFYFQPNLEANVHVEAGEHESASFNFSFDYQPEPNRSAWKFMIDLEIVIDNIASLLHRSEFEVAGEFHDLLNPKHADPMIRTALQHAVACYHELCRTSGLESVTRLGFDEDMVEKMSETLSEQLPLREHTWEANKVLHQQEGGHFTGGSKTTLLVQGTFVVLDQLMLLHPDVDHDHNRKVIMENIGLDLSRYNTLKLVCNSIAQHPIHLSFYQMIYLFVMVDAAAQVLLSDSFYDIKDGAEAHGLTETKTNEYLRIASEIRQQLNSQMLESGTSVDLLSRTYDWPELFR
jgi:hypothetical protein